MTEHGQEQLGNVPRQVSGRRGGVGAALAVARIVVPVALLVILLYGVDWRHALSELTRVSPWLLLVLFGVMIVELLVSTIKWSY
jgi:hypothetical protein